MEKNKLIPYSVYLPEEMHKKLKKLAVNRKASEMIRNAIQMIIDGHKEYDSGYNQALKDASDLIMKDEAATNISYGGVRIAPSLVEWISELEKR